MTTPTSLTIKSSIALRLRCLAQRIHLLGPRPLFEMMAEIAGTSANALETFERYGRLDAEFVHALGGDKLPPIVRRVR